MVPDPPPDIPGGQLAGVSHWVFFITHVVIHFAFAGGLTTVAFSLF